MSESLTHHLVRSIQARKQQTGFSNNRDSPQLPLARKGRFIPHLASRLILHLSLTQRT